MLNYVLIVDHVHTTRYSNCLLVGLNNRALVSQGNTLVIDSTQPFSSDGGSTTRLGRRGPKESTVRVDVFQETTSDHNIELQEMQVRSDVYLPLSNFSRGSTLIRSHFRRVCADQPSVTSLQLEMM